nr:aspartic proteinase nepenthesin-2-like [Quercus suber]
MDIGTPSYSALLVMDPGSDTTWIQGDGCSEWNLCIYEIKYFDASHTKGLVSFETFTFPTREGVHISYPNIVFGVGLENKNIVFSRFMGDENRVSGILGLGRRTSSIERQLKQETDLRFSYCLYDWTGRESINTYLHFGEDAQIEERYQAIVKTIPLLPNQNGYYVEVLGISMNEKRLQINPRLFQLGPNSRGGFVFDAGAALTFLVQNAYNIIRIEIVQYLQAYDWEPIRPTL